MNRKWQFILLLMTAGACWGRAGIVTFDFNGNDPGMHSPWTTTSSIDSNVILTKGFSLGQGLAGNTGDNRFNAKDWTQTGGLGAAEGNNDYFGFTLTPISGYGLNLDSAVVTFTLQVSATGPHSYSLVDLVSGGSLTELHSETFSSGAQTATFSYTFGTAGNDNIASAVEFRIYGYDATSGAGTMSVNAFSLGGTTTAVPEPAAWGAVSSAGLLALCGFELWRQRRSQNPSATF